MFSATAQRALEQSRPLAGQRSAATQRLQRTPAAQTSSVPLVSLISGAARPRRQFV